MLTNILEVKPEPKRSRLSPGSYVFLIVLIVGVVVGILSVRHHQNTAQTTQFAAAQVIERDWLVKTAPDILAKDKIIEAAKPSEERDALVKDREALATEYNRRRAGYAGSWPNGVNPPPRRFLPIILPMGF